MFYMLRIATAFCFAMLLALVYSLLTGPHAATMVEKLTFLFLGIAAYWALGRPRFQQFLWVLPGAAVPSVSVPDSGSFQNQSGTIQFSYEKCDDGRYTLKLTATGFNHKRFFSRDGLKRALSFEGVEWSDPHTVDTRKRVRVMTGLAKDAVSVDTLITIVSGYAG